MGEEEFTIYDAINFVIKWWRLYAAVIVISLAAGMAYRSFAPKTTNISTDIGIYPDIPGISAGAAAAELSEHLREGFPDIAKTDTGYAVSVLNDRAIQTSKAIADAIDKFEVVLRSRVASAKEQARVEFHSHPDNAAVYANLVKFQMLPDDVALISHIETMKPGASSRGRFLTALAFFGLFAATGLSLVITIFGQWRKRRASA